MKVICAQLDIVWEERQQNYAKVRALVDEFRPDAGALLVLPEMFSSGFSMNVTKIKEGSPSQTEQFLGAIARLYSIYIIAGEVTIGADGKGRNEAVVIDIQGRTILRYAKLHPFSIGGESQHYSAGDRIDLFNWLGFFVCPFIFLFVPSFAMTFGFRRFSGLPRARGRSSLLSSRTGRISASTIG
jgi:omega-amidase